MNKKEMLRIIFVIIFIVVTVVVIKLIQGTDPTKKELKNIGYSEEEINIILEKLEDFDLNEIVKMEYNNKLVNILNEQYYIPNNLFEYLEYSDKYNNVKDIISVVNVGAYKDFYTETKEVTNLTNSMLVNRYNYLNYEYNPEDIVEIKNWYAYDNQKAKKEVYDNYLTMWNAAKNENMNLLVSTSYRTYQEQENIYINSSDEFSSKPGFSEHQTGLALDILTYNASESNFENTNEYEWLKDNSYKYGFILRYPKDKKYITGYNYEPFHYRYLGVDLATKVYNSGLTYDEYYAYYCEYKKEC